MAKLPSFLSVVAAIQKTITRFPLETIVTVFGTVFAILLTEEKNKTTENIYVKIIMVCSLCLVLFLSSSLYFTSRKTKIWYRFFTSLLLGSLTVVFIFSFSENITDIEFLQFFALNVALHLLVSFTGFIPKTYHQDEFWEFNKQLFIRILTSGLYSIVLYLGLALAILAVKELFDIAINDKIHAYLFFIIAGVFNTIFFLYGVPDINNNEYPLKLKYPNGLKNFTQYVLLPLISIYLIILICYETKIIATLSLPVGWVSNLVLVFAIFGILSFLLIHPIATETENLWMRTFNRWFYYLLVPLLGLLFWAILYRIHLYGFTHERYYVLLLSVWLSIVVVYFIVQKQPKIKFIPISMCLAGLFSIIGPQSADSISKKSQLSRFESYMKKVEKEKLSFEQEQDLSSIIDFLEKNYTVKIILPFTKDKLNDLIERNKAPDTSEIMKALGLEYHSKYESKNEKRSEFFYDFYETNNQNLKNIHGYDLSFTISNDSNFQCTDCAQINGVNYTIKTIEKKYGLDLQINQDIIPLNLIDFVNKNPIFDHNNSAEKINQKIESSKYVILITYRNISGQKRGKTKKIDHYTIDLFVGIKK